jgi:hypothetical protein
MKVAARVEAMIATRTVEKERVHEDDEVSGV